MQRREFFKSLSSGLTNKPESTQDLVLRPPYNQDNALFDIHCKDCDAKCADVCEENIIKIAADKTPYLSFLESGCTFCDECADACEPNVLVLENKDNIYAKILISNENCISWDKVMCFSCKDPCLDNAIIFDGLFKPVIDETKCTSCGFCIHKCPVEAITVLPIQKENI